MSKSEKYFHKKFKLNLLKPKYWLSWLGILLLLLLALIPSVIRDPIAKFFAGIVLKIAKRPMAIARANIHACFPEKTTEQVDGLIKKNIQHFLITLFGQGELLFRSRSYIRKRVNLSGLENITKARQNNKPIIFIMPHVWAIDYAGLRTHLELPNMVTMAKPHKNPLFNWFNNILRGRFGGIIYTRQAGIRALISELKNDFSFFYLPDEDLGPKQSVFTPFFATVKATLPVVGRLAKAGNAEILPLQIGYDETSRQFKFKILPPIEPLELETKEQEALALNQAVEQIISAYPEQYMWFLKLLKTRPEGEPSIYQN